MHPNGRPGGSGLRDWKQKPILQRLDLGFGQPDCRTRHATIWQSPALDGWGHAEYLVFCHWVEATFPVFYTHRDYRTQQVWASFPWPPETRSGSDGPQELAAPRAPEEVTGRVPVDHG